ncbi:hypothetical protein PT015_04825 [Candidatus Mycobacterium wuenschmannii]|uniref:Uncharacterized protein n=1 Tax=Candidatus Mycobacterium wuenschmannii TaxID=3027808 RepID=A0ABY8W1C8_9MYCO|nr:hypothetical protein [Candidatus Mycobacterium wuenschmannii]WIM88814.1 hypothetical protein PT015_04825 [Candidatus Mycobacterium wuenschmannii]
MGRMQTGLVVVAAMACTSLNPAIARADQHNITYIARVDGVAPGSQATFITAENQTNMAQLSALPGNAFQASAVLPDPRHAGMQVAVKWPYGANVHCEIDVDDKIFVQVDQQAHPAPGSADPMNGVVACGAPLPATP